MEKVCRIIPFLLFVSGWHFNPYDAYLIIDLWTYNYVMVIIVKEYGGSDAESKINFFCWHWSEYDRQMYLCPDCWHTALKLKLVSGTFLYLGISCDLFNHLESRHVIQYQQGLFIFFFFGGGWLRMLIATFLRWCI